MEDEARQTWGKDRDGDLNERVNCRVQMKIHQIEYFESNIKSGRINRNGDLNEYEVLEYGNEYGEFRSTSTKHT